MKKRIKLFEQFLSDAVDESKMSEIDIIGQESSTKEEFVASVKDYLKKHAANPAIADDDAAIEDLAKPYFNEDGSKKERED